MTKLLKTLSAAFVVAGACVGSYTLLHGQNGQVKSSLAVAHSALNTLMAQADRPPRYRDPPAEIDQAKLPFIVIEPRDFAAPLIKLPAQPAATAAVAELRLTQSPDRPQMDLEPVEARLRARVPAELVGYFDLFLYISKAKREKGDWAQRMFVLAKQQHQVFTLLHDWAVSTGREEPMLSPAGTMLDTDTPEGLFKLDRYRFHRDYTSRQWASPMPNAMFFDWQIKGRQSGLAIHGADEQGVKELGQRTSHGCIRLAPENARVLFDLIRRDYGGAVPVFQISPDSGTMSTKGLLVRDDQGRVKMTMGYKVLVFIEDYGGPSVDTVAALY